MFFSNLNFLVIAVAALVSMGLGFVWFTPVLFGKRFIKEMGLDTGIDVEAKRIERESSMVRTYSVSLVLTLVSAFVLAVLINSLVITTITGYMVLVFFLWLGFSMPVSANNVLYGKDSPVLFLIVTGYQLVSLFVMTLVIGIFS